MTTSRIQGAKGRDNGTCVLEEAESGRYAIGPAAIAAGLSGLRSINVVRCASEKLPEIRDRTGETAVLAIWSDSGPVIVVLEESSRQIYMNIRVGSILPLLRSAVGASSPPICRG